MSTITILSLIPSLSLPPATHLHNEQKLDKKQSAPQPLAKPSATDDLQYSNYSISPTSLLSEPPQQHITVDKKHNTAVPNQMANNNPYAILGHDHDDIFCDLDPSLTSEELGPSWVSYKVPHG